MGGPNQALQMQQQAQIQRQQQQQQRAGGPGPGMFAQQQVHAMIHAAIQQQPGPLSGWQSQVPLGERVGLIYNV